MTFLLHKLSYNLIRLIAFKRIFLYNYYINMKAEVNILYLIKENKANRPAYALMLRIFGLLVAITAVTLQLFTNAIIGKGFMANHVLAYNTIQTNIICLVMFLALIIKTIIDYVKNKHLEVACVSNTLQLAATYFIAMVMLGYWPILAPMVGIGKTPIEMCNTLFLHLFTPLITIADTLLFLDHGSVKRKDSLKWLIYPIFYLILIITIAHTSDVPYYQFPMGDKTVALKYPYPMFDPQVVGIGGFIGMCFVQIFSNLLCSYLFICLDHKINKMIEKRRAK